jgi:hypothetical protein
MLIAEISGKALLPLVLTVSAVSVIITAGVAYGLFVLAKRLKLKGARMEGVVLAMVFAWIFVLASLLCAGCGVASLVG